MKTALVRLKTIEDVRKFIETVTKYDLDVDLSSGRYVVDAKSIMGIFSLDLLKPITLTIHTDDCELADQLLGELKPFTE